MTSADGPRLVTLVEFPELLALLDRYFAYEDGGMQARFPFAYDLDHCDRHAVVRGRTDASHAAAIPQTLSTGIGPNENSIECWGIGGVVTDRRYRGNSYMGQLLEFWFERMDDYDVALSELGGDHQRYAYENAGSEFRHVLTERSFDGESWSVDPVVGYDPDEHLETLHRVHEAEPSRAVRTRAGSRAAFGQRGLETFVYEGDEPACVIVATASHCTPDRQTCRRSVCKPFQLLL